MLALLGGQGRLPGVLIAALEAADRPYRLCEVEGFEIEARGDRPVTRFRLERLGGFIDDLVATGVTEICMAGRIDRPAFDLALVDAATAPLIPDIATALQSGDDSALRIAIKFFEQAGVAVVGAHEIAPELMPAPGVLTKTAPGEGDQRDADRGAEVIAAMAEADVGQACVVANGQVLAVEALPGTDWMLRGLAPPPAREGMTEDIAEWVIERIAMARSRAVAGARPEGLGAGGSLIKAAKPGQDRRVDLPAIGPETVRAAARARLSGIVIEAGGVMVLERAETVALADRFGLFLWVRA